MSIQSVFFSLHSYNHDSFSFKLFFVSLLFCFLLSIFSSVRIHPSLSLPFFRDFLLLLFLYYRYFLFFLSKSCLHFTVNKALNTKALTRSPMSKSAHAFTGFSRSYSTMAKNTFFDIHLTLLVNATSQSQAIKIGEMKL